MQVSNRRSKSPRPFDRRNEQRLGMALELCQINDLVVARSDQTLPHMVLRRIDLPRSSLIHKITDKVDRAVSKAKHRAAWMGTSHGRLNVAVDAVTRHALRQ